MKAFKVIYFSLIAVLCFVLNGCSNDEDIVEPQEKEEKEHVKFEAVEITNPENIEFGTSLILKDAPNDKIVQVPGMVQTNYQGGEIIIKITNVKNFKIESVQDAGSLVTYRPEANFRRLGDDNFVSDTYGMAITRVSDSEIKIAFDELELHENERGDITPELAVCVAHIEIADRSWKIPNTFLSIRRAAYDEGMLNLISTKPGNVSTATP